MFYLMSICSLICPSEDEDMDSFLIDGEMYTEIDRSVISGTGCNILIIHGEVDPVCVKESLKRQTWLATSCLAQASSMIANAAYAV